MELWEGSGDPVMDGALAISDISGTNGKPPLVFCGELPRMNDPRVYLALHQVVDVVHAASPVLGVQEREHIAANIGALLPEEADRLLARIAELEAELATAQANVSVPLAEVIDFFEAQDRLRPKPGPPEETPEGEVVA